MRAARISAIAALATLSMASLWQTGSADTPLTYATWIAGHGLSGAAAEMTADPDGDGVLNGMEYCIDGMVPTTMDKNHASMPALMWQKRNTDGSYTTVSASSPPSATNLYLVLRYKLRPGIVGMRITPQTSKNMRGWHWGKTAIYEWQDAGWWYARTTSNMHLWERQFMRLKVKPTT